jgi:PTS system beta-glucosides-specific IIC component
MPLFMSNLANLGYDVVILVTMFCSNIAQGGACFGVAAKTKDIETKSEGLACGISAAVAGITEPGMYGINLRFMKPMYAAVVAAGISGLWCGLTGVKGYTMGGSPSFMSLITFIGGDASQSFGVMHGVVFGAIGGVVSLVVAAVLAYILYNDKDAGVGVAPSVPVAEEAEPNKKLVEQFDLVSPMEGTVVPLADVQDEVFASGALGEGVAILPTDGNVYAPCDGAITTLMDSRHAIGMVADNGVELLIHVGLDTVAMNGAPFEYKIKQDQEVKKGDLLLVADLKAIEAAGYKLFTPIIVTNSEDYVSIKPTAEGTVAHGDKLMTIA